MSDILWVRVSVDKKGEPKKVCVFTDNDNVDCHSEVVLQFGGGNDGTSKFSYEKKRDGKYLTGLTEGECRIFRGKRVLQTLQIRAGTGGVKFDEALKLVNTDMSGAYRVKITRSKFVCKGSFDIGESFETVDCLSLDSCGNFGGTWKKRHLPDESTGNQLVLVERREGIFDEKFELSGIGKVEYQFFEGFKAAPGVTVTASDKAKLPVKAVGHRYEFSGTFAGGNLAQGDLKICDTDRYRTVTQTKGLELQHTRKLVKANYYCYDVSFDVVEDTCTAYRGKSDRGDEPEAVVWECSRDLVLRFRCGSLSNFSQNVTVASVYRSSLGLFDVTSNGIAFGRGRMFRQSETESSYEITCIEGAYFIEGEASEILSQCKFQGVVRILTYNFTGDREEWERWIRGDTNDWDPFPTLFKHLRLSTQCLTFDNVYGDLALKSDFDADIGDFDAEMSKLDEALKFRGSMTGPTFLQLPPPEIDSFPRQELLPSPIMPQETVLSLPRPENCEAGLKFEIQILWLSIPILFVLFVCVVKNARKKGVTREDVRQRVEEWFCARRGPILPIQNE